MSIKLTEKERIAKLNEILKRRPETVKGFTFETIALVTDDELKELCGLTVSGMYLINILRFELNRREM